DGKLLASASDSGIHVWEVASGRLVRTLSTEGYVSVRFSPDGKRLAAMPTGGNRGVDLLDADTGRRLWSWRPESEPLLCIEFASDGRSVLAVGWARLQSPP